MMGKPWFEMNVEEKRQELMNENGKCHIEHADGGPYCIDCPDYEEETRTCLLGLEPEAKPR